MLARHVDHELSLYCLGELAPPASSRVAEHLLGCARCRRELEPVRRGVAWARTLTPVAASGPSFREVEALLETAATPRTRAWGGRWRWPLLAVTAAAALLLATGGLWLRRPHVTVGVAAGPLSELEAAARAAYLDAAPAQIETDDRGQLASWIGEHTGIHVWLALDTPMRAQVIGLGGGRAVAFSYRMEARPGTVVAPSTRTLGSAAPAGAFLRKRITYRHDPADPAGDVKVLTWTRKDQSYALVSGLPNLGQQACFICHTDPERRQLIGSLQVPL